LELAVQGFVDIQVNGYAGFSFDRDPITLPTLQRVTQRLRDGGVRAILPTLATNDVEVLTQRLAQLRQTIDQDPVVRQMMPAFHVEGPCISPLDGYRGAHAARHVRPASRAVFEPLLDAVGGVNRLAMITLAPEHDANLAATNWLAEQGVIVCAGHTDAPRSLLLEAVDAGLSFYTHLGNGSAALMHRHDNIIHRVLSIDGLRASIIPDGHHVPFWLVSSWLRAFGTQRFVFTTDCVEVADAPADLVPRPGRVVVHEAHGPVCKLPGTPYLAGSAITMRQGCEFAVEHMGITHAQALALGVDQPAELIAPWL
jgi:N-acetylglucosamine-6-phosphate deacetylase